MRTWRNRLLLVALCAALISACRRGDSDSTVAISLDLEPALPAAGEPNRVVATVRDAAGTGIAGATLQLEAHMSHPGMAPIAARFSEMGNGVYAAGVDFTMAGDWIVVATGTLPDGRRFMQTHPVAVKPSK